MRKLLHGALDQLVARRDRRHAELEAVLKRQVGHLEQMDSRPRREVWHKGQGVCRAVAVEMESAAKAARLRLTAV